jgi:hypothetical protein
MREIRNYDLEQQELRRQLEEQTRLMEQLQIDIQKREALVRALKH